MTPHAADHDQHGPDRHGHDHHDHEHHDDETLHVNVRDYVTGFLLSVLLTAVPFWLVMGKMIPHPTLTAALLLGLAALQIVVHMVYFLHMNPKSEGGWNLLALLFTGVLVVIVLAGSLWVMFHLNSNMMPMTPHEMRAVP